MYRDPNKQYREIHTGLYGQKAYDIVDSLFGQLSDGYWENSPRMEAYWRFGQAASAADGELLLVIDKTSGEWDHCSRGRLLENKFYSMSDFEIKTWIAQHVKFIAKQDIKDNNLAGEWKRDNVTDTSCYLDRKLPITIADIYLTYEMLMGREVFKIAQKYDPKTYAGVVGEKKSDADTKATQEKRDKLTDMKKQMYDELIKFDAETKRLVEELQTSRNAERNNLYKILHDPIAAMEQILA